MLLRHTTDRHNNFDNNKPMAADPPQTPPTRPSGAPPPSMDGSVVMALEYTPTPHKQRSDEPVGERHEREVGYCVLDIQRRPWTGARP